MLIHCCGRPPAASRGRAGTPPVRALRNSGRVPLSLQKNAKGGGQDCSSGSLIGMGCTMREVILESHFADDI